MEVSCAWCLRVLEVGRAARFGRDQFLEPNYELTKYSSKVASSTKMMILVT